MAVWQGQKQDSPAQCTPLAVMASAVTNVTDAALWLGALHWPPGKEVEACRLASCAPHVPLI